MAQKNAPLRLAFSEGELTSRRRRPTWARQRAAAVPFAGEPFEIGFNPEFLIAGLESAGSEDVVLKLISPLRPGLLESARRQRLPLPHHADPPERLRRPWW